jgi:hypothetical protein
MFAAAAAILIRPMGPVLARHNGAMAEEIEDVRLEDFLPRRALTGRPEFPS